MKSKQQATVMCLKCNYIHIVTKEDIKKDDIVSTICFGSCGGNISTNVVLEVLDN